MPRKPSALRIGRQTPEQAKKDLLHHAHVGSGRAAREAQWKNEDPMRVIEEAITKRESIEKREEPPLAEMPFARKAVPREGRPDAGRALARAVELKYETLSRQDQEARVSPQDAEERFGEDVERFNQAVRALSDAVPPEDLHGAIRGMRELLEDLKDLPPHLRRLRPWSIQDLSLILGALRAREH